MSQMNAPAFSGYRSAALDVPIAESGIGLDRACEYRGAAWWVLLSALVLTVLEGAVRKWVVGSAFNTQSLVVYFSKDIVFALLLLLPFRKSSSRTLDVFGHWLLPGSLMVACGALLSGTAGLDLAGAVLTSRAVLFLPVLAFFGARRLQGISLASVVGVIGLLVILNFLLGVVQNRLPPGHLINRYVVEGVDITTTATGVRATGTFSYITGMAVMSAVGVWAGLVQLSLPGSVRQRMFGWAVLASGLGCGLASVSRGPVLMAGAMIAVWCLASGKAILKDAKSMVAVALLLIGLESFGATSMFSDLGTGLLERAKTSGGMDSYRAFEQIPEMLIALEMAPLGRGLGFEQIGRAAYSEGELADVTFESQLPRIVLELGFIGLGGFLVICAAAINALQVAKRFATENEKSILLSTQMLLILMFVGNVAFNHVASAFVWLIFAAVMASVKKA